MHILLTRVYNYNHFALEDSSSQHKAEVRVWILAREGKGRQWHGFESWFGVNFLLVRKGRGFWDWTVIGFMLEKGGEEDN